MEKSGLWPAPLGSTRRKSNKSSHHNQVWPLEQYIFEIGKAEFFILWTANQEQQSTDRLPYLLRYQHKSL